MIGGFGGPELIIVLVILVLLFGAKKIPELAKGLGTGMREFRKGSAGEYEVEDKKKKEEELSSADDKNDEDGNEVKDAKADEDNLNEDVTVKADREEQRQS